MAVTPYPNTNDLFAPLFQDLFRPLARSSEGRALLRAPEADVLETEREILVMMDVPGSTPDEIEIVLENNVLTVNGERRQPTTQENEKAAFHLAERRYGQFSRSFILPRDVDQDAIQASFENGVLTVTVPKSEKARRRRIEIQGGDRREQVGTGSEVH